MSRVDFPSAPTPAFSSAAPDPAHPPSDPAAADDEAAPPHHDAAPGGVPPVGDDGLAMSVDTAKSNELSRQLNIVDDALATYRTIERGAYHGTWTVVEGLRDGALRLCDAARLVDWSVRDAIDQGTQLLAQDPDYFHPFHTPDPSLHVASRVPPIRLASEPLRTLEAHFPQTTGGQLWALARVTPPVQLGEFVVDTAAAGWQHDLERLTANAVSAGWVGLGFAAAGVALAGEPGAPRASATAVSAGDGVPAVPVRKVGWVGRLNAYFDERRHRVSPRFIESYQASARAAAVEKAAAMTSAEIRLAKGWSDQEFGIAAYQGDPALRGTRYESPALRNPAAVKVLEARLSQAPHETSAYERPAVNDGGYVADVRVQSVRNTVAELQRHIGVMVREGERGAAQAAYTHLLALQEHLREHGVPE